MEKNKAEMAVSNVLSGVFIINQDNEIVVSGLVTKNDAKKALKELPEGTYRFGEIETQTRKLSKQTVIQVKVELQDEEVKNETTEGDEK